MPDVETKVSTVSSAYQGHPDPDERRRGEDGARTGHGRCSYERFKLLPDGSKTEVQNKKTVKERSKLLQGHLRSNFWGQIFGVKFLGSNFWNQIFGVKFLKSNFRGQIFWVKFFSSNFWGQIFGPRDLSSVYRFQKNIHFYFRVWFLYFY